MLLLRKQVRQVVRMVDRSVRVLVVLSLLLQPAGAPGIGALNVLPRAVAAESGEEAGQIQSEAETTSPSGETDSSEEPAVTESGQGESEQAATEEETASDEDPASGAAASTPSQDTDVPEAPAGPAEGTPAESPVVENGETSVPAAETANAELSDTDSSQSIWEKEGESTYRTTRSVVLGETYRAPQDESVTVTFTKLPAEAGRLTIREIKLSSDEQARLQAVSDTAYDITTSMEDGSFAYELELPLPKDQSKVQVKYAEDDDFEKMEVVEDEDMSVKDDSVLVKLDHLTVFVLTQDIAVDEPRLTIIATKVVCTDEADLPNYGETGAPDMTATTASDWVAAHDSCSLASNWDFQWSYDGVENPGDNTGAAGAGWNTFGPTDADGQIGVILTNPNNSPKIWVREVWQDGYTPFSYAGEAEDPNANDVSAEIYCHEDGVNYDNWDFVNGPQAGETYYCVAWNVVKPGTIIVKKQTDPAGSEQSFTFNPSWSQDNFSLSDGEEHVATNLLPGTYSVEELKQTGWRLDGVTCSDGSDPAKINLGPDETVTCVFKNQETATVTATKIVCTDEADLPNYGELGGPNLTATSAIDWVNSHESCSFQKDWQFQWAYQSTSNPGDNTGASANPDWHTFGPTDENGTVTTELDLKSSSIFWVREVWSDSYIPFSYDGLNENPNYNDVSAEFYCHTDVVNYDNYDYIDASSNLPAYYCVGWNVPTKGTIVIEKETVPEGSEQSFTFNPSWSQDNFSLSDGGSASFTLEPGSYAVEELATKGWDLTSVSCRSSEEDKEVIESLDLDAGETITCVFTNTEKPGIEITATKIVCTDEADLPNYGLGGPTMTATTAIDWVNSHESCSFKSDWQFEWSLDGVPNPGDENGVTGGAWNTFGPTDENGTVTTVINNPETSKLWFREVYDGTNYVPFSYDGNLADPNSNDYTSEFYCHTDVVNYDNWEWIETEPNEQYYCVAWNVVKPGTIIVKKQTDPAGSEQSFTFNPSWSQDNFSLSDGEEHVATNLLPGTYSVEELKQTGWRLDGVTCSDGSDPAKINLGPDETVTCVFKNQETATVTATKIVCTDEADLPNYGELGGPNLTATSAIDWVNSHESCSFQKDWQFQWAYQSTSNPGDNTGASANPDWHTFGPTDENGTVTTELDLKSSSIFWVREVWSDSYIPFSYDGLNENPNHNDVSAEFYCHTDVVNYDNYDYIDASSNLPAYYCVGWNVPNNGEITGYKWNDLDGDAERTCEVSLDQLVTKDEIVTPRSACEPTLPGWTIFIDANENNALDEGETSTTTNEDGSYYLENLAPGTYRVCEVMQEDWQQTYPAQVTENLCHTVVVGAGETEEGWNFGNTVNENEPALFLKKSNDSVGDEVPGNTVVYTLEVTALNGPVDDVTVTDLPPEGFEYVAGSGSGAPFIHEYASPGIWDLGDMAAGETKVLTYTTTISASQDAGRYEDLAFARGTAGATTILANAPSDPFVGTDVNVVLPVSDPTVTLDEDKEVEKERKKKTVTQYVLGASTELPLTGTPWGTVALALAALVGGALLRRAGRRERNASIIAGCVLTLGLAAGMPSQAEAASLSVDIETPAAVADDPDFKIGFVALDVLGRPITVKCYTTASGTPFATYNLDSSFGGNSGDCQVSALAMPADGVYEFYVQATATGDGDETVESNHVMVTLASSKPGTPVNYERGDPGCQNVITFTTANDGGKTVKVELYRSTANPFVASAATKVAEQAIGSNAAGNFSVPAPGCDDDVFYAIRAVDAYGHGSSFVGDTDVDTETDTVTTTTTNTVVLPGAVTGAIAVNTGDGSASQGGAVQGATTETPEGAEIAANAGSEVEGDGSVLGDAIEAEATNWFGEHPWLSAFLALLLVVLGFFGYRRFFGSQEHGQPLS